MGPSPSLRLRRAAAAEVPHAPSLPCPFPPVSSAVLYNPVVRVCQVLLTLYDVYRHRHHSPPALNKQPATGQEPMQQARRLGLHGCRGAYCPGRPPLAARAHAALLTLGYRGLHAHWEHCVHSFDCASLAYRVTRHYSPGRSAYAPIAAGVSQRLKAPTIATDKSFRTPHTFVRNRSIECSLLPSSRMALSAGISRPRH